MQIWLLLLWYVTPQNEKKTTKNRFCFVHDMMLSDKMSTLQLRHQANCIWFHVHVSADISNKFILFDQITSQIQLCVIWLFIIIVVCQSGKHRAEQWKRRIEEQNKIKSDFVVNSIFRFCCEMKRQPVNTNSIKWHCMRWSDEPSSTFVHTCRDQLNHVWILFGLTLAAWCRRCCRRSRAHCPVTDTKAPFRCLPNLDAHTSSVTLDNSREQTITMRYYINILSYYALFFSLVHPLIRSI